MMTKGGLTGWKRWIIGKKNLIKDNWSKDLGNRRSEEQEMG